MKLILTFALIATLIQTISQDLADKSKFPLIQVDTLHVYSQMIYKNEKINLPDGLIKVNKQSYPVSSFFIDKLKTHKAYLLFLSNYNCIYLLILNIQNGNTIYSDKIASYVFFESAYEEWKNAWIADFNKDGNLDIGIYKRLIDFELPTNSSDNISIDEKYLLIFKNGKFHQTKWDINILEKFQLLPKHNKMKSKEITIKGIALNAKLGAIIQTDSGEVYYLTGVYEWPDEILEKKVKAKGTISREYHDPKNLKSKNGAYKTGMSGEKVNLQNAKWEVID